MPRPDSRVTPLAIVVVCILALLVLALIDLQSDDSLIRALLDEFGRKRSRWDRIRRIFGGFR